MRAFKNDKTTLKIISLDNLMLALKFVYTCLYNFDPLRTGNLKELVLAQKDKSKNI